MYLHVSSYDYDNMIKTINFLKENGIEYHVIPDKDVIADAKVTEAINGLLLTELPYSDFDFKNHHIERFNEIIQDDEKLSVFKGLAISLLSIETNYRYALDKEVSRIFRNILESDEEEFNKFL